MSPACTEGKSINSIFLVSREVFLSNSVRYVCMCVVYVCCVCVLCDHFDGGVAVRMW